MGKLQAFLSKAKTSEKIGFVLILILVPVLLWVNFIGNTHLPQYERQIQRTFIEWAATATIILSTAGLGAACYYSYTLEGAIVERLFRDSESALHDPWQMRGYWLLVSFGYGLSTTHYHPAIAALAAMGAFVAIEHIHGLSSAGTAISRLRQTVGLLENRLGIETYQGFLHGYYKKNWTVRGTILWWDWQLHLKDDLRILNDLEIAISESVTPHAARPRIKAIVSQSYLGSSFFTLNEGGKLEANFATSCFLERLIRLLLSNSPERFAPIHIYGASPTMASNQDIPKVLPFHNYRSFTGPQCLQNFLGCCSQTLFVSRFNRVVDAAVKHKFLLESDRENIRSANNSRIKLELVTSPPWHYTISRSESGRQGITERQGFVTQLFRGVGIEDVAVDITAEERPGSLPFQASAFGTPAGSETFARYEDLLERLELESVPLEPYLVSIYQYFVANKAWTPEGVEEALAEAIHGARNWKLIYGEAAQREALKFYETNVMAMFIKDNEQIGARRVPGSNNSYNLIRRIL